MKELWQLDLNYQIKYKQIKTKHLIQMKQDASFQAELVGEYKMKLFLALRDNLNNLIVQDNIEYGGNNIFQQRRIQMFEIDNDQQNENINNICK